MTNTDRYDTATYARVLNDTGTQDLLDSYRTLPSVEIADELERRGVTLWHHGLRRAR